MRFFALEFLAVNLLDRINARTFEVMPQAERMADFVRNQMGQQRTDE